uniref:GWxTD domain-containing protein n=1 Tax=candidate division WOR-3 bacterium TaxID=2052148 RepID=A0A7C4CAL9_UNCW3
MVGEVVALLGLLAAGWTQVHSRGDMRLTVDVGVFPVDSDRFRLEAAYSVPFTSLTFVRAGDGFKANMRISLQVLDRSRNVVAGDVWDRIVLASDFGVTAARDSFAVGMVELNLPRGGTQAQLEVIDVGSERRGSARFAVEPAPGQLSLRVLKSGRANPGRTFGINDTIEVEVGFPTSGLLPESIWFAVGRGARAILGSNVSMTESSAGRWARFLYAVADSDGTSRMGAGEYWIEAKATEPGGSILSGRTTFTVALPFFWDDSAYKSRVDQLVYVAAPDEIRRLRSLPRVERERAWREFWQSRDSNPSTTRNEAEEEYFERIRFAEENFRAGDNGYRSDRGSVYVRYGPPDQIEARPFEIDRPAEQVWSYYSTGMHFRFVDRFGSGLFLLVRPGDFNGW